MSSQVHFIFQFIIDFYDEQCKFSLSQLFTISSTSSVHHRFVLSVAQVQFYRLFPCMLQLQLFTHTLPLHAATAAVYTHTLSLRAATAAVYTHSSPACCNCSSLHTHSFPLCCNCSCLHTHSFPVCCNCSCLHTHSFPVCCNCSCLHMLFTHTLFPCMLHILCWLRNPAGCEGSVVNQFLTPLHTVVQTSAALPVTLGSCTSTSGISVVESVGS